ncbi:response regulator transcription factor [Paenibacillus whitsoniae]|uniref:Response regulator n=1 Tax=Paenibacillus whitsoniae TaxID=2496558 RepID=A0A3S0AFH4_9BACL|nr:response regulator [Paenibacillus whitsoniae]RTE11684.1 response regulator [Paenibacillus whitsoniae]
MYTFIIVDDEALIRRGMLKKIQAVLPEETLTFVGEADNGESGLELIKQADPDIVITDMRMPEMDGKSFLKLLQQEYPDKKIIVVSGYSDFEYMKEAISAKVVGYLLKPFSKEEISETLKKAVQIIEAERSTQRRMAYSEIEKEEISYHADLQTLSHWIMGLQHKDKAPVLRSIKLQALSEADQYVLLTLYTSEKTVLKPDLLQQCDGVNVPSTQNDQISFLLLYRLDRDRDLQKLALSTANLILKNTSPSCACIGISSGKASLTQLSEAFEETVGTMNERTIAFDSPRIAVYQGDLQPAPTFTWDKLDELLFFLESGNASKVIEWTEKLFDHFYSDPGTTLGQVKSTCKHLIHEVRDILNRYYDNGSSPTSSSSFEAVLAASFDVQSIRTYLLQVLPNLADMLDERSVYTAEHVVENIKLYIENHFNKELTLEKISSLFFMNPSYCSYLFKEKTGINFIDYVNKTRIEKAKAMLKGSDAKVYKIAKDLGYDNAKYFFRVFKKVTGQTPEEYRQSILE